jgi:two-component system, NarL family, sensor kinase
MTAPEGRAEGRPEAASLWDLARMPELRRVLVEHASRGFRVQVILRCVLVLFVALTVILVPPLDARLGSLLIVAAYVVWAVIVYVLVRGDDERVLRFSWIALYGDVVAVGLLTVIASLAPGVSWTADILLNGLYFVPVLAAVQLRPWVALTVVTPNFVVFVVCSVIARQADVQPWSYVLLRALVLAGISLGCVLLVRVQASRVLSIGRAVTHRAALLGELLDAETRERTQLSERLHDGALQYVLAARQDLEDLPPDVDPLLRERLGTALGEAGSLLRAQVGELTPAILDQAGLVPAITRLAEDAATRGRFTVDVAADGWPDGATPADRLLFDTTRELLANVVKHAGAGVVRVALSRKVHPRLGASAVLTVSDDGVGIAEDVVDRRLREGHVGLATRRLRVEAAGGALAIDGGVDGGTIVTATVPLGAPAG